MEIFMGSVLMGDNVVYFLFYDFVLGGEGLDLVLLGGLNKIFLKEG